MSFSDDRRSRWRSLLAEQETSGLSAAAFCREQNISVKSFGYWRKRLSQDTPASPGWLAVIAEKPHPVRSLRAACRRSLTVNIGIVSVDLQTGFDAGLLREVVRALELR